VQRCAGYEREVEQLRRQLVQGAATAAVTTESHAHQESTAPADMQQAMDILKRSSLEVELAAKEGEVRLYAGYQLLMCF